MRGWKGIAVGYAIAQRSPKQKEEGELRGPVDVV